MDIVREFKSNSGYYYDKCINCYNYEINGYTDPHGFKCDYYGRCFAHNDKCTHFENGHRDTYECVSALERLMRNEPRYEPHYVISAIMKLLKLKKDNRYRLAFNKFYYVLATIDYDNKLDLYDIYGKKCANFMLMRNDVNMALYVINNYLNNFVELVNKNDLSSAYNIYVDMLRDLFNFYNIGFNNDNGADLSCFYPASYKRK